MLSVLNRDDARSKVLLMRLADEPKSPAIIDAAEMLCAQGRYSEAIARLRSVELYYGGIYRFNLVLARAYRDAGEMELAKQHYEKACHIAPQNEIAIRELIALTAFPQLLSKPASSEREAAPTAVPSAQSEPEPETQPTFKLNREELSKVFSRLVGSAQSSDAPTAKLQPPAPSPSAVPSSAAAAFQQTDRLLEQEPDIDALAREMMDSMSLPPSTPDTATPTNPHSQTYVADESRPSTSASHQPSAEQLSTASIPTVPSQVLSFEEALIPMQTQGADIAAFTTNQDVAHHSSPTATLPSSQEPDLDALAREMMNAQLPRVEETNDPTPISEQRKPFSDDEEIKTPTRQLAKIFQSQGAYAKAIKVYHMLAEREPENASLYEILIDMLREKMATSK